MPERIAAALLRHIVRLRIIRRQAIVALPTRRRAIHLPALPVRLQTIAAILRIHRQAIAALPRHNHPAPVVTVDIEAAEAGPMAGEAATAEAVLVAAEGAVVPAVALRADILPKALRAAARA